jgi:transcription elongation GreA/GreB family factor
MQEYKERILELLRNELTKLKEKKEILIGKLDTEKRNSISTKLDPDVYSFSSELSYVATQIKKVEGSIGLIQQSAKKSVGEDVRVGDCIILENCDSIKVFYLTDNSIYVDPKRGIISSHSPLGGVLLGKRYGEKLEMQSEGQKREFKLVPF